MKEKASAYFTIAGYYCFLKNNTFFEKKNISFNEDFEQKTRTRKKKDFCEM